MFITKLLLLAVIFSNTYCVDHSMSVIKWQQGGELCSRDRGMEFTGGAWYYSKINYSSYHACADTWPYEKLENHFQQTTMRFAMAKTGWVWFDLTDQKNTLDSQLKSDFYFPISILGTLHPPAYSIKIFLTGMI